MLDNSKTEEFLQKLAPCIERGELEKYVEEEARAGCCEPDSIFNRY